MLPTLQQAKEMFDFITSKTDVLNVKMGLPKGISKAHYQTVAYVASKIAEACLLDVNKAYLLGLFHDYGEYIEDTIAGTFHGTAGYDELIKKGFDENAKVCLTHSFFDNDFDPDHFVSYESKEIVRAGDLIKKLRLDDYDYLIQLSDLLSAPNKIIRAEERLENLSKKYNIKKELVINKIRAAKKLKDYFSQKSGKDIYNLLKI